MTEPTNTPEVAEGNTSSGATAGSGSVSRRGVLLGLGAVAGTVAGAGLVSSEASAGSAVPRIGSALRPEAVAAPTAGLTYIGIDAHAFVTSENTPYYSDATGRGNVSAPSWLWYPLVLPVGTKIHRVDVGYQGQPILQIQRRPITSPNPAVAPADVSTPVLKDNKNLLDSPGGPFSDTVMFTTPVTIEANYTYLLAFFVSPGSTVLGAYLGYEPSTQASQAFFPFTGPTPRVLDTREPGPLTGKLQPEEERVVDLGITGARTAVINLTVTQTVAAGYVAAFANGIAWPGNSSINWSTTNTDAANGVIVAMDATGKIKIRGGANETHVVIDRIGYFL